MSTTAETQGLAGATEASGVFAGTHGQRRLLHTILYTVFTALCLIYLLPFAWMISTSLKLDGREISMPPQWIPDPIVWENYFRALTALPMLLFLRNTLIITITATALGVVAASLAGYAFGRLRFWGRDALFFAYLGTLMVPGQVTLIPSFLILTWLGWVNTYEGLIVPRLCAFVGVFLMRQSFLGFPPELEDAARIDGCSRWRVLWQIVLPLSAPAITALAVLAFTGSWNDFLWPLVVVSSERMKTVQLGLAAMQGEAADWSLIMAAAALSALPLLVLYAFLQRAFTRGIVTTGLRG
jgi:multiple sugar transport system permease protein